MNRLGKQGFVFKIVDPISRAQRYKSSVAFK